LLEKGWENPPRRSCLEDLARDLLHIKELPEVALLK
jgi:hypothetical protein